MILLRIAISVMVAAAGISLPRTALCAEKVPEKIESFQRHEGRQKVQEKYFGGKIPKVTRRGVSLVVDVNKFKSTTKGYWARVTRDASGTEIGSKRLSKDLTRRSEGTKFQGLVIAPYGWE